MSENTKQTQPPPNNIVSTETLPIMVKTIPTPDWLNTITDTSNNISDNIPRPILRRHSPSIYEQPYKNVSNNI